MSDENIVDDILKIGLILGSIWLGSEILKNLSKEKGRNDGTAGTQPPNI